MCYTDVTITKSAALDSFSRNREMVVSNLAWTFRSSFCFWIGNALGRAAAFPPEIELGGVCPTTRLGPDCVANGEENGE